MNKPSVMIYFNMIYSPRLPDAGRLRLNTAGAARNRRLRGGLGVAWDFIAPVLALDDSRYERTRAKRSMARKLSGIARRKKAEETNGTDVPTQTNSNQFNSVQFNSIEREYIAAEAAPSPRKIFT